MSLSYFRAQLKPIAYGIAGCAWPMDQFLPQPNTCAPPFSPHHRCSPAPARSACVDERRGWSRLVYVRRPRHAEHRAVPKKANQEYQASLGCKTRRGDHICSHPTVQKCWLSWPFLAPVFKTSSEAIVLTHFVPYAQDRLQFVAMAHGYIVRDSNLPLLPMIIASDANINTKHKHLSRYGLQII